MLNYTLEYSPQLEEKEVRLTFLPIKHSITLVFARGKMHSFLGKSAKKPDLHVCATPSALLAMILKKDKTKLKMEGDAVLGQALEKIFDYANIDWEKLVHHFLGESLGQSIGYPVVALLKKGHEKMCQIQEKKKNQMVDYLQEDMDMLPLGSEVRVFCDEVDHLKLRVDRLEALVNLRVRLILKNRNGE